MVRLLTFLNECVANLELSVLLPVLVDLLSTAVFSLVADYAVQSIHVADLGIDFRIVISFLMQLLVLHTFLGLALAV